MDDLNGLAISIAWPEYRGKQTSSWYDPLMRWLGFNKNYEYQVGHAALLVIERKSGNCFYFDCGRFHAPYQCGRIRSSLSDPQLNIITRATFTNGKPENIADILNEVQNKRATFGIGPLYASSTEVNVDSVLVYVRHLQSKGSILFGPFVPSGTNCCRFVRSGILAGKPDKFTSIRLNWIWPVFPTPLTLVRCLSRNISIIASRTSAEEKVYKQGREIGIPIYTKENVEGTLPAPDMPPQIPANSQWLSGEVVGSWFHLENTKEPFRISRYAPDGELEFSGLFVQVGNVSFDPEVEYHFTYLSHFYEVSLIQNGHIVKLRNKEGLQV